MMNFTHMKLIARVVKCNKPNSEVIYSEDGGLREIQVLDDKGEILHKSGPNHPETTIHTIYGEHDLISPPNSKDVFLKIT